MDIRSFLIISHNLLFFFCEFTYASDTVSSSHSLSDGKTLVSKRGTFELGFFSRGTSKNRYIGIWYKNIPVKTVVWVANGLKINDSSGLLMINSSGNLVLMSQNRSIIWSPTLRTEIRSPVVAQLLDSGNLILRDEQDVNSGTYLWQSFDYPSDTLLPEMKLGWDLETRIERRLSAWRSPDDPSPGDFTWRVELQDSPDIVLWKGSQKFSRSGPWNGLGFSGAPPRSNPVVQLNFVSNDKELYFTYNLTNKSEISMIVMNQTNYESQRLQWNEETQSWKVLSYVPRDYCDNYGVCGANGYCISSEFPFCRCLKGFKNLGWTQGCVRNKPLNNSKYDGFIKFAELRLPDTTYSWVNKTMDINECREKCLENSSCMAYTSSDIRGGGSGCIIWFGDLIDIRYFSADGQELFIRMSASELGSNNESEKLLVVLVVTAIAVFAGVLTLSWCIHKIRRNRKEKNREHEDQKEDLELPLVDLDTISKATNNFSVNNMLGKGGFGPVFRGTLMDGQEIAVKRLSKISRQGFYEFKNEVILIAKLQHRNLVKLLACCIQGEEKLLIYEFMPNKSLDYFIFGLDHQKSKSYELFCDLTRRKILDWSKRYNIICGIARGLLYLHQDSRLRIVHRDLKASNILLDHEMNPKISDFGLARTFGGDEIEGSTNRVVGTYGYMAPEYASDGRFSIKSDVFSFGILMLEIVSGNRNKGFYHVDQSLNITGHAWKLWKEGKPLELLDSYIGEPSNVSEVVRCIHISLLCVQQNPEDRPSMSSVVLMLGSEIALPQPKQPGFLLDRKSVEPSSNRESFSTNEITLSEFDGR